MSQRADPTAVRPALEPEPPRRATVALYALESGGCGACAQSLAGLRAPRKAPALRASGLAFVASPRHADVLLLAGPLSARAGQAVRRIVEATPLPRAVIAVGDCAIDGCVFAGSGHLTQNPAAALDVNVEIAGCPPSPDAILAAIIEAARLLAGSEGPSAPDDMTANQPTHEPTDDPDELQDDLEVEGPTQ